MPKLLTARRRRARELRDACLMLVARHGLASRQGGAPATAVERDPFQIRLAPSGSRREMNVWHTGTGGGAKVLSLWWSASAAARGNKSSWRLMVVVPPRDDPPCPWHALSQMLKFPIYGR